MGLVVILLLTSCVSNATSKVSDSQASFPVTNLHEATLDIKDMYCGSCALGVEYQLKQVDGVVDARVSYTEAKGYIKYDADKVDAETVALASDVYPAKVIEDKKI